MQFPFQRSQRFPWPAGAAAQMLHRIRSRAAWTDALIGKVTFWGGAGGPGKGRAGLGWAGQRKCAMQAGLALQQQRQLLLDVVGDVRGKARKEGWFRFGSLRFGSRDSNASRFPSS